MLITPASSIKSPYTPRIISVAVSKLVSARDWHAWCTLRCEHQCRFNLFALHRTLLATLTAPSIVDNNLLWMTTHVLHTHEDFLPPLVAALRQCVVWVELVGQIYTAHLVIRFNCSWLLKVRMTMLLFGDHRGRMKLINDSVKIMVNCVAW